MGRKKPKLAASRLSLCATSKDGREEASHSFFPLFSLSEIAVQINCSALEHHGPSNLTYQGELGNLPRGWEAGLGDPTGPTECQCFLTKNCILSSYTKETISPLWMEWRHWTIFAGGISRCCVFFTCLNLIYHFNSIHFYI